MFSEEEQSTVNARAFEKLRRDLGPVVLKALDDPCTVEVLFNADGGIWQERLGEPMERIGEMPAYRTEAIIKTVAGYHGKTVTRLNPLIEGELPLDGSRFAGQIPPVVQAPTLAIRKKAVAIFTLDQYVEQGIMTANQATLLRDAVMAHHNILVVGGTGSGKTTLVNAIIHEMVLLNPTERVCIIEDTGEIQCEAENVVQYHTTLEVTMTLLLKTILRMRPDRILVGEVRGAEALDLGAMPGADSAGYAGFRDQVNNHYFRLFASAFLLSGVTAGISYSQDCNSKGSGINNNNNASPTVSSELSQALGQQLGQVTSQLIAKNMNIAPTLEIRPGYRFNVIVVKDLTFRQAYQLLK